MSVLDKIKLVKFPPNQYYKVAHPKDQIVLHHTVSGKSVNGDLTWWLQTASRIATCVIIDRNGIIWQCYRSGYWAHHLGIKKRVFDGFGIPNGNTKNVILNQRSIGVELDSWGGLVKGTDGNWYNAVWNKTTRKFVAGRAKVTNVQEYPDKFRGFYGFEKYTAAQIETLRELLEYWKVHYEDIPFGYNEDIWDVNKRALSGEKGIFTHVSYRKDKSDCHPQPELIEMLKGL